MGQKQERKDQKPESCISGARDKIIIHIGSRPTYVFIVMYSLLCIHWTHELMNFAAESSLQRGCGGGGRGQQPNGQGCSTQKQICQLAAE
jgi:hypothetical protein